MIDSAATHLGCTLVLVVLTPNTIRDAFVFLLGVKYFYY